MTPKVLLPSLGLLAVATAAAQAPSALDALKKTAVEGDTAAMVGVGLAYAQGKLVAKDLEEAQRWYRMAAEKGDADGMTLLGSALVRTGKGGGPEGLLWLRKAAEAGNPDGQAALGLEFLAGKLLPKDPLQAYGWMVLGIQGGAKSVDVLVVEMELSLPPELLAKAVEEANRKLAAAGKQATWRPVKVRAEAGDPAAEYAMGFTAFLAGTRGVRPDLKAAYVWLSLAKAHGSKEAEALLPHAETFLKATRKEGPDAFAQAQAELQRRLTPVSAKP